MKDTCLLFLVPLLTMSCAALMQGTSYAVPSQPTSAVSYAHASNRNHPRSRASLPRASRPTQLPSGRKRSAPWNAANLQQPHSDKSGSAAKGGVIQNEAANNVLPVRRLSVTRPNLLSLNPSRNNLRHRGPTAAIIGGSANLYRRNSRAINGTRMHRKP